MQSRIDDIFQEGARLFSRNGFEGTSLREVASACGISMAAIHYHFTTKEELHNEITQFCFEEFIERIVAKQRKMRPALNKPSALIAAIFDAVLEDPTLFNLMQHDMRHLDEDLRRTRTRTRSFAFIDLIGDTMRKEWGSEPDETAVIAATSFLTGYCGLVQIAEQSSGPERAKFIARNRHVLLRIAENAFDRPNSY